MTRRCKLKSATTANFLDEVELDVITIDTCGIVLGSPYIYNRRFIFHRHEKKYHLINNGIKYIVRVHNKKLNASLVNLEQMNRIDNASQNFSLLMLKHEDVDECKALQEYDSSLKCHSIYVANASDKMFQELNMLPSQRSQHMK